MPPLLVAPAQAFRLYVCNDLHSSTGSGYRGIATTANYMCSSAYETCFSHDCNCVTLNDHTRQLHRLHLHCNFCFVTKAAFRECNEIALLYTRLRFFFLGFHSNTASSINSYSITPADRGLWRCVQLSLRLPVAHYILACSS